MQVNMKNNIRYLCGCAKSLQNHSISKEYTLNISYMYTFLFVRIWHQNVLRSIFKSGIVKELSCSYFTVQQGVSCKNPEMKRAL